MATVYGRLCHPTTGEPLGRRPPRYASPDVVAAPEREGDELPEQTRARVVRAHALQRDPVRFQDLTWVRQIRERLLRGPRCCGRLEKAEQEAARVAVASSLMPATHGAAVGEADCEIGSQTITADVRPPTSPPGWTAFRTSPPAARAGG
jgi:hypothetical protein